MLDIDEIPEEEKEIPSYVLPNLITWLRDKGHSDSEVFEYATLKMRYFEQLNT